MKRICLSGYFHLLGFDCLLLVPVRYVGAPPIPILVVLLIGLALLTDVLLLRVILVPWLVFSLLSLTHVPSVDQQSLVSVLIILCLVLG